LRVFDQYDGIWIEGGLMLPLVKAIYKTRFDTFLMNYLQKDTFFVGTSAGSMVCATSLDCAEWYIGEPEPGVAKYKGLGLVDYQIYPHFNKTNLPAILSARLKHEEYWLLKDGQAISFDGNAHKICGGDITVLKSDRNIYSA